MKMHFEFVLLSTFSLYLPRIYAKSQPALKTSLILDLYIRLFLFGYACILEVSTTIDASSLLLLVINAFCFRTKSFIRK